MSSTPSRWKSPVRLATLVILTTTLAGCVVLPWGHGRHHGHGKRHYSEPDRGHGHERPADRRPGQREGGRRGG